MEISTVDGVVSLAAVYWVSRNARGDKEDYGWSNFVPNAELLRWQT